ncbi:MAG: hypothetical protein Q9188_007133 [Gyalolechia gomerana]
MREPHYGCKAMTFAFVKWPFLDNASDKIKADKDRWLDSYPIWVPCCLMLPFGWLFRGRTWPDCKKGHRRRTWEAEKERGPPPREQTKYPETRISPCSLRPRAEDDNISSLELDQVKGFDASLLKRLPLEIRQEIYGYVLGRQENCLILLPFKIRAVPEGHYISKTDVCWASTNERVISGNGERFWSQRPALLRTCRQIYMEAISLLYSGNTFIIKHPELLLRFAKAIPPQRLDCIRTLRICLQPWHCGFVSHWAHSPSRREEWETCWKIVAAMQNLLNLDVEIVHELYSHPWTEEQNICQTLLPSLLRLRGLHSFRLAVIIRHATSYSQRGWEVVPLTKETKALMQMIEELVKLPREAPDADTDPEEGHSRSQHCLSTAN